MNSKQNTGMKPARRQIQPTRRLLSDMLPARPAQTSSPTSLAEVIQPPSRRAAWRMGIVALPVLAVVITGGLLLHNHLQAKRYVLSAATQKLVGNSVASLDKQVSYNTKTAAYQYNASAASGIQADASSGGDNGVDVDGANMFGVSLAKASSKGQTYTDAQTKLSFSLVPLVGTMDARHEDGHIVYPFSGGQMVYSLKANGLKEDVVVTKPLGSLSLRYQLKLPSTLAARQLDDGSIGIYSADPSLFASNISYGSPSDEQATLKARTNSAKNNLVFLIPAPIITESGQGSHGGQAKFSLYGSTLSVTATNLEHLSYPISIDPSVAVSGSGFAAGNAEDSMINIGTSTLVRNKLTGGTLSGGWGTAGGTTFTTARQAFGTAVYNGYVYITGGNTTSLGAGTADVEYAQIGSSGSIGSWSSAGSISGFTFIDAHTSVAYNGYLYVIAGNTKLGSNPITSNSTNVQYALICTGSNSGVGGCGSTAGSLGTWITSSATGLTGRYNHASVAYNGYIYVLGGCTDSNTTGRSSCANAGLTNSVQKAKINIDGSLGNWSSESSFTTARFYLEATAYNGYMYIGGGCTSYNSGACSASGTDIQYAPINNDGTLGTWVQTTSFTTARQAFGMMAYGGYMYVTEGCTGGSNCNNNGGVVDAQYAPIYANGTLGSFTTTTAPGTERYQLGSFAYNGYLFMVGGCVAGGPNCSSYSNGAVSAQIDTFSAGSAPSGTTGSWTAGSSLVSGTGVFNAASATYNGYVYMVGGCTTSTCSSVNSSVQYAAVCNGGNTTSVFTSNCTSSSTPGTMSSWKATSAMSSARYGVGVFAYAGYLYAMGGCSSGTATSCSTYLNTVEYAPISSTDGSLGTWTSLSTPFNTNGRWGMSAAMYNGYAYLTGGTDSTGTTVGTTLYAPLSLTGGVGPWTVATTAGTLPVLFASTSVAYNGYLYMLGGQSSPSSISGVPTTVQYALINSNGSLSTNSCGTSATWCTGANNFGTAVTGASAQAYDGVMYLIGGSNSSGTAQATIQYAQINASGAIGTWATAVSNFTNARQNLSSAIVNGYLYVIGGINGSTPDSSVYYSTLQTQARVAHYSIPLDPFSGTSASASDEVFTRYRLSCSASCTNLGTTSGILRVSTNGASTSWTTVTSASGIPLGSFTSLAKASGRYAQLYISIDDSQTAIFSDTTPTTVERLGLFFHANTARRLRGGQTFSPLGGSSGTNTQLDTEGP